MGISSLGSVDAFGDFKTSAWSAIIEPYFTTYQKGTFSCSLAMKAKNQYRMFWTDGTGLNLTLSGLKIAGFTRLVYEHPVLCAFSGEDTNGDEMAFFGSSDGFVYQLEKGTSFDGTAISALFKTTYNTIGLPENKKRFFKVVLERDGIKQEGEWGIGNWDNFEWGTQGS